MLGRHARRQHHLFIPFTLIHIIDLEECHVADGRIGDLFQELAVRLVLVMPPQLLDAEAGHSHRESPRVIDELPASRIHALFRMRRFVFEHHMREIRALGGEYLPAKPARARQILADETIVRFGQFRMIRDIARPKRLLNVVVGVAVAMPSRPISDQTGEQSRRDSPGFAHATEEVEVAVPYVA